MKSFPARTGILAGFILLAGAWRLLITSGYSPLANFTPVGAMALFGGCYFADRWKALLFPLLTLWLSDLFLDLMYFHEWKWFYEGALITYASFALMVGIGKSIRKVTIRNVAIAGIAAALAHWTITDFGVWLDGKLYPQTAAGLSACYAAALPYLKNMVIGNLLFSGIMFGMFEWAQRKYPQLLAVQA